MITIPEQKSLCTSLFLQGKKILKLLMESKIQSFLFFFLRFLILNAKTVFQKGSHLYYEQQAVRTQLTGMETKGHSYQNIFVFLKY